MDFFCGVISVCAVSRRTAVVFSSKRDRVSSSSLSPEDVNPPPLSLFSLQLLQKVVLHIVPVKQYYSSRSIRPRNVVVKV